MKTPPTAAQDRPKSRATLPSESTDVRATAPSVRPHEPTSSPDGRALDSLDPSPSASRPTDRGPERSSEGRAPGDVDGPVERARSRARKASDPFDRREAKVGDHRKAKVEGSNVRVGDSLHSRRGGVLPSGGGTSSSPNGQSALRIRCLGRGNEGEELAEEADRQRRHTWVWRSLVAKNDEPGVLPGPQVHGPGPGSLQPFWVRDFEERYLFENRYAEDLIEQRRARDLEE